MPTSSSESLDNILDQSLERVLSRGVPIDDAVSVNPEHAGDLKPLLMVATDVRRAVEWTPSPSGKEAARQQMFAAVALRQRERRDAARADEAVRDHTGSWRRALFGSAPRWALGAALSLVFAGFVGFGTVSASQSSMPDQPLYPVKRFAERVQMAFVRGDDARSDLYMDLADRRTDEIVYLARSGKVDEADRISGDFQTTITQFKTFAAQRRAELRADRLLQRQQEANTALMSVAKTAPEDVRAQIVHLADTLNQGFASALGGPDSAP